MAYATGHVLDERYRVLGVLGEGGHGVVYVAEDELLGAKVAIKCLHASVSAEPGFKVRMHREARAMGRLSGTSAAQIFAFQKAEDGTLYIVMEHLVGRDLEAYLLDIERHGGRIDAQRLLTLLTPIAHTLDKAHELDLVHRDLKPGNIFVLDDSSRGGIRLLDFGLAKDLKADSLTMEGMVAGSPAYIAPEIWRGKAHQADRRIDVYSFATVIFRALAGKTPFDGKQPLDRLLFEVIRAPRPSLRALRPELPAAIDDWVQKALAIDAADRFPTVGKMWSTLASIIESRGAPAVATAPAITEAPWEVDIDVDLDEEVRSLRSTELAHGKLGR